MRWRQWGPPWGLTRSGTGALTRLEGDFARDPVAANFGEIHQAERVPGRIGRALAFDGKKSCCMIYDDATLRLPNYFTLEAWIKVADPKHDQTILSKAPRYTLCLRGGKLALRIGGTEMIAEGGRVPANRWVHVAVTFGMRRMYSRATFYLNGVEDSWVQPAYATTAARPETFVEAVAQTDTPIVGGPNYQEYGHKNQSTDNLVIGMDNSLRTGAFEGIIDEVAIHREDVGPERIAQSVSRHYLPSGEVASLPLARPAGARWLAFEAQTTRPPGTKIIFDIESQGGEVLQSHVKDGSSLTGIGDEIIVLRAHLATSRPGQTPILHSWSVSCEGGAPPTVVRQPFPEQAAALSLSGSRARSGVLL